MNILKQFGRRVRELRSRHGFTQAQLRYILRPGDDKLDIDGSAKNLIADKAGQGIAGSIERPDVSDLGSR